MGKGISSRNSLKALAYPVQQFLTAWGERQRVSAPTHSGAALPAPYELAALRGEAVLRQRFFGALMDKLPVALDASQQLALWQQLVEHDGHITDWVQRLGVARALRREATVGEQAHKDARKLFTLLLDALAHDAPHLLPWAAEGFFFHVWRQQFPANASPHSKSQDVQVLRQRLQRALSKQLGKAVQLRESFKEVASADEAVASVFDMTIQYRASDTAHWQTWVQLQRPRLKTARLAAYSEAVREFEAKPEADKN